MEFLSRERIHAIRIDLDKFASEIDTNIILALEPVEDKITQLNSKQLLKSKGADDGDLINERTGSPYLSKAYAKRMKKSKPNIFVSGAFQKEMFLQMDNAKEYFISSYNRLVKYLPGQYLNMFGISKADQPIARQIWKESFRNLSKTKTGL